MKGLVLSGGTGTRMQPFTWSKPKQLIPVANRPLLGFIMSALQKAGITHTGIIIGNKGMEQIPQMLEGETPPTLEVTYIRQKGALGLAHAVKTARPFLGDDDFMLVLGDNIFDLGLSEAVDVFKQTEADALLFLTPVDDPQRYGIAEVRDGRIISLVEKPVTPHSNLAIMGIYLLNKAIFPAIDRTRPSARGELEITDALQELLNMGGKIVTYLYRGWWLDVGEPEDVLAANRKMLDLLLGAVPGNNCSVAPSARVTGSTLRGPLIIGEGCCITNAVLGPYCAIGRRSVIENARIMESVVCEDVVIQNLKARLCKSIIAENARIQGQSKDGENMNLLLGAGSTIVL
jgi:glucose-1-phosphate thymidylyltransferase